MTTANPHSGKESHPEHNFPSRSERDRALTRQLRRAEAVSSQQLYALGYSKQEVGGLVSHGDLQRQHRGVYVDGRTPLSPRGHLRAALLALPEGAFLSHRSGLAARGYRPVNTREIHVSLVADHTPKPGGNLVIHRCQAPLAVEVGTVAGLKVATVVRLLLDIAQVASAEELAQAVTEAARREALDPDRIELLLAHHARRPGIKTLRKALDDYRPTPAGNSNLEAAFWRWFYDQPELPAPDRTNVHLGRYEFDAIWEQQRFVLELDSRRYHLAKADFEKDRLKDSFVQKLGYRVARVTETRFELDQAGIHTDLQHFLLRQAA